MPAWMWPGRCSPNDAGDRAADGPDQAPGPLLDRACGGRGAALQLGEDRALLALERVHVLLERVAALTRAREHPRLLRAHGREAVAPIHELDLDRLDLLDLLLDRLGDLGGALLELVEPGGRCGRLRLCTAHALDQACVAVGDALQELGALEQVGEAVGLEHDRDDVGLVGLVHLDQAIGEQHAGLGEALTEPRELQPLPPQVLLDLRELGALGVEAGLQPHLLGLEHRDVGLQVADPAADGADVGRQDALTALVLLDLRAVALDLALDLLRAVTRGDEREGCPQRERQYRHREQEAESSTHAAGHARRPPGSGYQRSTPRYGACKESCNVQGFSAGARRAWL